MPRKAHAVANGSNDSRTAGLAAAFVVATLDQVSCGIPASAVVEITRAVAITPLPSAPRGVEGIVDYHGEVIPVVDLRNRLALPPRAVQLSDHFMIVRSPERLIGLRVDVTTALVDVAADDVVAAERVVAGTRPVAGIARTAQGLVLLQDLGAMLSQAEEERLRDAMANHVGDSHHA